jgi:hypothetical protein
MTTSKTDTEDKTVALFIGGLAAAAALWTLYSSVKSGRTTVIGEDVVGTLLDSLTSISDDARTAKHAAREARDAAYANAYHDEGDD